MTFFFQAEDGIRDYDVTGVQTCALPILQAQELERKTQSDKTRVVSDMAKAEMRQETETKRIDAQTDIDGARLGVEIAKTKEQSALKEAEISEKAVLERAKLAAEVARLLVEDERSMSKER